MSERPSPPKKAKVEEDKEEEEELDEKVVLAFFKSLLACRVEGEGILDDETKEMIRKYPKLLEIPCPEEIESEDDDEEGWEEGDTAAEGFCGDEQRIGPSNRDCLFELVELGLKATDELYGQIEDSPDYFVVLLLSGYMPLKLDGEFLLDQVAASFDMEDIDPDEIMEILCKKVQSGDSGSNGKISAALVRNISALPNLEVGVTHAKGGKFEEWTADWYSEQD